jgi:hypothetical protein
MKCARCSGLMVADQLLDVQESYLPMWVRGLRCVTCGNIEDPLIHHHRIVQRSDIQSARETLGFGEKERRPPAAA